MIPIKLLFKSRNRAGTGAAGTVQGTARLGRRTKHLIGRLQPGEIAVIDHADLDRIAAEGLVERKVKAVLNAALSSSGGYPNLGPLVLTAAGIILIDDLGLEIFDQVRDGETIALSSNVVLKDGAVVAEGTLVTPESAQEQLDSSKRNISSALESFAENTIQYMTNERDFLLEEIHLPEIATKMEGRHVLVVVRGYGYKQDLHSLRSSYIGDFRPVLLAVDGGADALIDLKLKPDIIIGDMDSVTTATLKSGAELIVHAYPGGKAPGQERLDALGLDYITFEAPGTSEDVAMLLANEKGAELIVAVGARASMVEFMDKGRKGMASTFLVRLRVGPKLVDAKGVSSLHRGGPTRWELFGLVLAAFITMLIVIGISQPMQLVLEAFVDWIKDAWFSARQAIF